jgi:hypothetical protein
MSPRILHSNPPKRANAYARCYAWILWFLTFLFAGRVAGQALQRWSPQSLLPPFHDFQGSHLPYPVLLAAQLLILAGMLRCSWQAQRGTLSAGARVATALLWCGSLYMAASLARLGVGLGLQAAPPWFRAWISGVFHLVLAGFVLALAAFHRRASSARESSDVAQ